MDEHARQRGATVRHGVDSGRGLNPTAFTAASALIEAAKEIDHVDASVLTGAADRISELVSADPFVRSWPHIVHGDAVFRNVIVPEGRIKALLDFEWARNGPRDLELVSAMRWLQEDYPKLFEAPDLDGNDRLLSLPWPSGQSAALYSAVLSRCAFK